MSKSLFLLLLLPSLAFSALISVDISEPHVVVLDKVEPATLTCSGKNSFTHQYCCWTGPHMESCDCDDKKCPVDAHVESDQQVCSITLNNPGLKEFVGNWTCDLFFVKHGNVQRQATTQIFVIDHSKQPEIVPLVTDDLVLDQGSDSVQVEYKCDSSESQSPWQTYEWFLAGHLFSNVQIAKFNLTRNDFNQSLKCQIKQSTRASGGQVHVSEQEVLLKFSMSPMITSILRLDTYQYSIQVESWPLPNLVRISAVEECDHQCVVYNMSNDKYIMNTSPYLETYNLVKDVNFKHHGAKVEITLSIQPNQSQALDALYVKVDNGINEASAKVDLKSHSDQVLRMSTGQDFTFTILIIVLVTVCVVILLALVIHFRTFIWESFKCGVYLVPSEEDEEEIEKGQEANKNKGQL